MATIIENAGSSVRSSNQIAANRDIIGIAFPFRKESGEFPKKAINIDAIKSDIISLFKTPLRSRIMRPTFGSNKEDLVFESTGPLLRARLERNIRQTILNHEPRVRVVAINIVEEKTLVTATVLYVVQGISDTVTLSINKAA